MSKKYELKQWYPSLSSKIKLGDLVEKLESSTTNGYAHKSGAIINTKDVENNPVFWEEVVVENYEILSYINKVTSKIGITRMQEEDPDNWEIFSVKRLSDGQKFTVGDMVYQINQIDYVFNDFTISNINLDCNDNPLCLGDNGDIRLSKIRHTARRIEEELDEIIDNAVIDGPNYEEDQIEKLEHRIKHYEAMIKYSKAVLKNHKSSIAEKKGNNDANKNK